MLLDLPPPFPIKITFSSLVLVVGIAFSFLLAFALWLKPYNVKTSSSPGLSYNPNRILAALLCVFAIMFLEHFLEVTGYFYYIASTIVITEPTNFLVAPLLYAYVYCLSHPGDIHFRPLHCIHIAPFLIATLLYTPWIMSDLEGQFVLFYADAYLEGIATKVRVNIDGLFSSHVIFDLSQFKEGLVHHVDSLAGVASVYFLAKYQGYFHILVFVVYIGLIIQCLWRHKRTMRDVISNDTQTNLNWFYHFFILIIVGMILYGMQVTFQQSLTYGLRLTLELLVRSFAVASVLYLGFRAISQPQIFSLELSRALALIHRVSEKGEEPLVVNSKEKYHSSSLPPDLASEFMLRVNTHMAEHQSFLDGDLSLPKLAHILDMSIHDLSQVINSQTHSSFYDYVNSYRVEYFKAQLKANLHNELTIVELAIASGFNSKSAFYNAFKKIEGVTPSQWKKQQV